MVGSEEQICLLSFKTRNGVCCIVNDVIEENYHEIKPVFWVFNEVKLFSIQGIFFDLPTSYSASLRRLVAEAYSQHTHVAVNQDKIYQLTRAVALFGKFPVSLG